MVTFMGYIAVSSLTPLHLVSRSKCGSGARFTGGSLGVDTEECIRDASKKREHQCQFAVNQRMV